MNDTPTLVFGPCRLDVQNATLERDGAPVALTPKAFSVLHHLARHAGRLVTKEEFLDVVWPGVFVGDAALKVCIREIRKALGDDPQTPTYIQTAHRRGYRFVAPVTLVTSPRSDAPLVHERADGGAPGRSLGAVAADRLDVPATRYAHSGDVSIAYQVVGDGPIDLVFVMGWVSHLDYFWREPSFARFLTRLASFSRLILFDKRGTGLSDRVTDLPTLEQRMDDVRAVMDAVGSERAVLMGVSEGGPLCSLFATTYPARTLGAGDDRHLRQAACGRPTIPWGQTRAGRERFLEEIRTGWGGPVGIEVRAPSRASDPAFRDWWSTYLRMGASPGAAADADPDERRDRRAPRAAGRSACRRWSCTAPTISCLKVEEGRYVAAQIPGATFVELPGDDHLPFVGDQDAMLDAIEPFLERSDARRRGRPRAGDDPQFTRVGAPGRPAAGPEAFEAHARREIEWFRGRWLGNTADGLHRRLRRPGAGHSLRRRRWPRRRRATGSTCAAACTPVSAPTTASSLRGPAVTMAETLSRLAPSGRGAGLAHGEGLW